MNMKKFGAAILVGAIVAGCSDDVAKPGAEAATGEEQVQKAAEKPVDRNEVVLSVGDKKLTRGELVDGAAEFIKANGEKDMPEQQMAYFKQMAQDRVAQGFIVKNVLVAKAKEDGFVVTDDDRKAREAELLKALAGQPNAPKSMEEYFKKFPLGEERARAEFDDGILIDKMVKDAQAKAAPAEDYEAKAKEIISGIVSNNANAASAEKGALEKIKSLKAELDKTPADKVAAKFAELAKAHSACPSGQKGGDLGEFTHGQMVKEFDEAAFKLEVGKISEPVKTQFGYHLIMTTKKVPAVEAKDDVPASPEKVQASHILVKLPETRPVPKAEEVVDFLKKQGERKFGQEFVMKLLKTAKIVAFDDEFKKFIPPADEPAAAPVEKPAEK